METSILYDTPCQNAIFYFVLILVYLEAPQKPTQH